MLWLCAMISSVVLVLFTFMPRSGEPANATSKSRLTGFASLFGRTFEFIICKNKTKKNILRAPY